MAGWARRALRRTSSSSLSSSCASWRKLLGRIFSATSRSSLKSQASHTWVQVPRPRIRRRIYRAPPTRAPVVATSGHSCCPTETSRSEEHTSELQSLAYLVCRLLLEKKKKKQTKGRRQYEDSQRHA